MRRWFAIVAGVALVATGCAGAEDGADPSDTQQPTTTSPPPTAAPSPPGPITWGPPEVLDEDSPVSLQVEAVAGPGGFVAPRERGGTFEEGPTTSLFFSPDGESWDRVLDREGLEINGIVAGGPGYVVVGTQYLPPDRTDLRLAPWAAWSADGRTWQEGRVALPAEVTNGLAETAGTPELGDRPVIVPVTAGVAIEGAWLTDVVATPDGFVALGGSQRSGQVNILWTSADGTAWSPEPADPFGDGVAVQDLVAGTEAYVAYGNLETGGDFPGELVAWHSDDALAWEPAAGDAAFLGEMGEGPLIGGVVPLGAAFVMVGTEFVGPPLAWVSPDGSEWGAPARLPSLSDVSAEIHAVAASAHWVVAGGREVVTGEGLDPATQFPGLWASRDGVTWTQVPPEELRGDLTEAGISVDSLAETDGDWLALGRVWEYPEEIATAVAWAGR